MGNVIRAVLVPWQDFYLVTGTAAAALTALQFVTQTMMASTAYRAMAGGDPESGIGAFGSPTVVHFTLALLLSAVMCAPWPGYAGLRATLVVLGAGALAYSAVVLRRTRRQQVYRPVAEDWIWHVVLPAVAYAAVLVGGVLLRDGASLFALAGATLLLLCVGIHNSWDTVTYLAVATIRSARERGEAPQPDATGDRVPRVK